MKGQLKSALLNRQFIFAILLCTVVLIIPIWQDIVHHINNKNEQVNFILQFVFGLGVGPSLYMLALICAVPYTFSFADEWNTGYYKHAIIRYGAKKYALHKMIAVSLSGGIICMLSIALYAIVCISVFPSVKGTEQIMLDMIGNSSLLPYLSNNALAASYQYVMLRALLAGLFGALWSCAGLTISAFITNRYVALITPFILSFMMLFISSVSDLMWLSPATLLNPNCVLDYKYVLLIPVIYLVQFMICGFIFYIRIERRYKYV